MNNEIVGFCRYTLDNLFSKQIKEIDGEICAIYVKPDLTYYEKYNEMMKEWKESETQIAPWFLD